MIDIFIPQKSTVYLELNDLPGGAPNTILPNVL